MPPASREGNPKESVGQPKTSSLRRVVQGCQLLSQRQVLQDQFPMSAKRQRQRADDHDEQFQHAVIVAGVGAKFNSDAFWRGSLGQAIRYVLRHWQPLTRFLEVAGAPLDSNVVERALKRAILHRKASLFYKTRNGAQVGDLFMALIHTCELNRVEAFEYLTILQGHLDAIKAAPAAWLPWTYRETLQRRSPALAASA